jgi:hypothetical protein
MRTSTLLNILAILLIIAVAALIGSISNTSSVWDLWILHGVVIVLCIGILLTGGQMRSIHLKGKSSSVEDELSLAEARFAGIGFCRGGRDASRKS